MKEIMNSLIGFEHIKNDYLKKKANLENVNKNQSKVSINSQDQVFDVIINKPKDKEKFKAKLRHKNINYRTRQTESETEEENQINLSQQRMQMKAQVYERLSNTIPNDEINSLYSVDFQKKYLDRDDLSEISEKPMMQYSDSDLKISEAVHFQEVFGEEARELGVGYYKFSLDEAEREAQLAEFRRMTEEREHLRASNPELLIKIREKYRTKIMSRMKRKDWIKLTTEQIEGLIDEMIEKEDYERKAKQRKLEEEIEAFKEHKAKNPRPWDIYKLEKAGINLPATSDPQKNMPDIQDALVKNIPHDILRGTSYFSEKSNGSRRKRTQSSDSSHSDRSRSRSPPVRVRDLRDIPRRPQQIMNQEKWVDKQREERNPDFAPPTNFYNTNFKDSKYSSKNRPKVNQATLPINSPQVPPQKPSTKEDEFIFSILEDPLLAPFK